MQIRQTSIRSTIITMLIIASLITLTLMQYNNTMSLYEGEQNRTLTLKLANQLRNKNNESSRLIRLYVSTEKPIFSVMYKELRANQKKEKLVAIVKHIELTNLDELIELDELTNGVKVTAIERSKLMYSQKLNDVLEVIELKIISLVSSGETIKATKVFNSDTYLLAKLNIVKEIDEFVGLMDQRINKQTVVIEAKEDHLLKNYLILLLIIIATAIFEYMWGTKKIIAPIEELTRVAENMAAGDYKQRADIGSDNEIGLLANTFNDMAESIEIDIADRKRTGEEVETLRQKAEDRSGELEVALNLAKQATQAKGEFLASMSHEIRTPMNGVVGMADLLSQTQLTEDQRVMLNTIRDSGNSLLTIINDILDFSKIEAGKLNIENVPLFIGDVLEGASATISPNAARKNVHIITYVDPKIPQALLGDPVRLRQIIFNLTGNAVKFSDEGEVFVRADIVSETKDGLRLKISIIDNGIGITEEAQKNLFDAFSQADNSTTRRFGGTGLGLTICKGLTDMMDGTLSVESQIGSGSTFCVELFLNYVEPQESQTEGMDLDLAQINVLAITESEALGGVVKSYLEYWKANVDIAPDGNEAEKKLQSRVQNHKPYDVVLFDFNVDEEAQSKLVNTYKSETTKFLKLTKGQRRSARIQAENIIELDGNPVRQSQLIDAVAVAVGRASPLIKFEVDDDIQEAVEALSVEEALSQGTLILLAEDNITNQKVIGRQLDMLGYTCVIADDGKLALKEWNERQFALLLSDCHMPNMDGYELTDAIRKIEKGTGKHTPIIAVTANALEGEAQRCIAAGMDDYLSKPLAMNDLKTMLKKWMPASEKTQTEDVLIPPQKVEVSEAVILDAIDGVNNSIDPTALKSVFGDDEETFIEILKEFVEPSASNISEIEHAFENRSADGIAKAAHKLKSSARSVGANDLADLCQTLEAAGKSENWGVIDLEAPRLSSTMQKVTEYIGAL